MSLNLPGDSTMQWVWVRFAVHDTTCYGMSATIVNFCIPDYMPLAFTNYLFIILLQLGADLRQKASSATLPERPPLPSLLLPSPYPPLEVGPLKSS